MSEHKILNHDFYISERGGYFAEAIYENDSYKDYKLRDNQFLRLRLLHPDKAEALLGTDLIYEQFDLVNNKVRFVHLQYKTWNANAIYFSDTRMVGQIEKMNKHLCTSGFCNGKHGKNYTKKLYRYPYCSGFLRPTSDKISSDSKMISTGYHLPICELFKMKGKVNKISKENIKGKSLSHQIFEECFTSNQLGSRWISIDELDAFYIKSGLNYTGHTIRETNHSKNKEAQERWNVKVAEELNSLEKYSSPNLLINLKKNNVGTNIPKEALELLDSLNFDTGNK